MNFTIYNTTTGEIIQSGQCPDSDYLLQQVPENCLIIDLPSDPSNQYIQNNQVFDKPSKPNDFSVFDYSLKQWVPNSDLAENYVKTNRNRLLYQSDWTQLPNSPLTTEKQQEWAVYRQQLRDITSQSGYPFNVVWPTQPE